MIEIKGQCQAGFEGVKEAFARNFDEDDDVGASFAATVDGKFVVDIWAGHADAARTVPWERDTIVNVWSTTKAMAALCTLMLVDRGQLDPEAPVAEYWPEFAQAGKEKLPVKYLLSHSSGLAGFEEPIPPEALYDWQRITGMLARQAPWWEPGTASGYHSLTFGYLLGELVRRITGKTMGTFFREEVAEPLGADFHIGLAAEHDKRVGELIPPIMPKPGEEGYVDPADMSEIGRKMGNPIMTADISKERAWRAAEIPAANGHGNARAVARVTAALACGGTLDGVRLLGMETIEKAITEQISGTDLVMQMPIRFGLGYGLNDPLWPQGPNPRTFFWGGWGGSTVVIDLDARISHSYVMNRMDVGLTGDPRSIRLREALYASL
jgi:CubicO group peptidase (beta-lactamase class C family)